MRTYLFETATYSNSKNFCIDSDYIKTKCIKANDLNEALQKYQEDVKENHYTTITTNGIKTKSPMCIDTLEGESIQVGYVIKASTYAYSDERQKDVKMNLDLWINIDIISSAFEEGLNL